jgi:hypothetical protein
VKRWRAAGAEVVLVVEPGEVRSLHRVTDADILQLKSRNKGIGFARHCIAKEASRMRLKSFIMADDDQSPHGNVLKMAEFAKRRDVLGVGISKSIQALYTTGTKFSKAVPPHRDKFFLHSGSFAHQIVAINVRNLNRVNGYDSTISHWDDHELARCGVALLELPWYVYTGAWANQVGIQTQGGIADLGNREKLMYQNWVRINRRWPAYVSDPGNYDPNRSIKKQYKCRWRLMFEDFGICSWPPENIETKEAWDWKGK